MPFLHGEVSTSILETALEPQILFHYIFLTNQKTIDKMNTFCMSDQYGNIIVSFH